MNETETEADEPGMTLAEMFAALRQNLWLLAMGPLAAGLTALGITLLIAPTFTASTTVLPPQQAQSGAASALASLGSLAGLAGGAAGWSTILRIAASAVRMPDKYGIPTASRILRTSGLTPEPAVLLINTRRLSVICSAQASAMMQA